MTVSLGTPLTSTATRALLLGSGELGKEVAIELMRLGVEVIAADRYAGAPAMQVAHRARVVDMLDARALRALIDLERPHLIIPEIEAIATDVLAAVESTRLATVVPTARATQLTMNREGIRRLAAEDLGLPTSPYRFADSRDELEQAVAAVGVPCVVKPVMSSSGKGQSVVRSVDDAAAAWDAAASGGRAAGTRVIVEGFVDFDYEITQLTVRHSGGTVFLDPIGHVQVDGDYRESWQPQAMTEAALAEARRIAGAVTQALGGFGVFGVELFVAGDRVLFNEVSPRPHDTGLVTLASQDLSEFALHARAVLGLPVPDAGMRGPAASCAVLAEGSGVPVFSGVDDALARPGTDLRLFGKPRVDGRRRVGVTIARGDSVEQARATARAAAEALTVELVEG
ncbi:formate-dependent phosphoribosylglycinamide formyltransferase [Demequina pelophila]|uniref:formate-dependent phosphoribosylglycinamide formyltransferase n=1 Tax=Demequina pelophila TaxID=1638984 RepID=UPI000781A09C|nr:formate-dependent phosphoribosylglycinamide formyltransferase [Demequina pelophila]